MSLGVAGHMSGEKIAVTRSDGRLIPVGDQTVSAVRYEQDEDGPQPALLTYTLYRSDDYATYVRPPSVFSYLTSHVISLERVSFVFS
jgi:hypothetical protein